MSSIWTIQCTSGDYTSAVDPATLNLSAFNRTLVSQAPDVLTFQAAGNFDSAAIFPYNSTITLNRNGFPWFSGIVKEPRRIGEPNQEALAYTVYGPWYYLEKCIYQQVWKRYDAGTGTVVDDYRSRVILCQTAAGARITSGAQISAAITYAISMGAAITLGTVDPAIQLPWSEERDLTCAEVIIRMLRWSPDAVCWFDYATTPPTFHCRLRANLTAVSYPVTTLSPLSALSIIARKDLQVPGVLLRYEQSSSVDGTEYQSITEDSAGNVADLETVISTIELAGSNSTSVSEKLVTEAWPSEQTDKAWWKKHCPPLQLTLDADLTISDVTIKEADGTNLNTITHDRFLLEGRIQDWMTGITGIEVTVAAIAKKIIKGGDGYSEVESVQENVSFNVIATNAATGTGHSRTYHTTASATPGESVPVGVAAALYAAWNQLQYDGQIMLTAEDAGDALIMGRKLNLTGGLAAWTSMNAIVQQVSEALDSGVTTIIFGPARQISPADMISLLAAFRRRQPAWGFTLRTTAIPAINEVAQSGLAAKNDAAVARAEALKQQWNAYDVNKVITGSFIADPAAVVAATVYKALQINVAGGVKTTTFDYLRAHS